MACQEKTGIRCKKSFAACTNYEGTTNENSTLIQDTCISIEETTQDIYNQLEQINLSALGDSCLDYVEEDGKLYVKNVLLKFEEEICTLKNQVQTLQTTAVLDTPLTNFNFQCLQGVCDNNIITLGDLLNSIVTRLCD